MIRLGVVTGLALEATTFRRAWGADAPPVRAAPGAAAAAAARALLADGATALLSFGTAGGLDPALAPGDLVVPASIESSQGQAVLRGAPSLARSLGATPGPLLSVDAPLLDPVAKREARQRYAAAAVDMESARVVRVAHEAGVPALVVRAIADPAQRRLPRLASTAIGANGAVRPWAVALGLARYPSDWPAVAAVARDSAAARASLGRAAATLAGLARQGLLESLFDMIFEDVDRGPLL